MSSKLTKTFLSVNEVEKIDISCIYDSFDNEISDVKVTVWNKKEMRGFDMTSVWCQEPFLSLIDNIDWQEMHYEQIKASSLQFGGNND